MRGDVRAQRCTLSNCRGESLRPPYAALLVIPATTFALGPHMWTALGLGSVLAWPITPSLAFLGLLGLWFTSVCLGVMRRHENELWCFVDSFGIPGILGTFLMGLKILH